MSIEADNPKMVKWSLSNAVLESEWLYFCMSVERKEGATVRNALDFDVRIEAVEAVC